MPSAEQVLPKRGQQETHKPALSTPPATGRGASRKGAHLCEVGVPGVEDCRPEPSIEGDLGKEEAAECGTSRCRGTPKGILWGKGSSTCPLAPGAPPKRTCAPPPPPSPPRSGSASHHPEPPRWVGGLKPPQVSGLVWEPVPAKSSSLVTQSLKQQPPGCVRGACLLPQLAGDDSPTQTRGASDLSLWGWE